MPPLKSVQQSVQPLTRVQKETAQGLVNVFETGSVKGDYSNVTLMAGDTGHLTYGRSQTTLGSGNLTGLIEDYCAAAGAKYASALRPYIPRCRARDLSLDSDADFKALLRQAGADLVMRAAQDAFFDRVYWQTAARLAASNGIVTPLGVCVVYDSIVHGSFALVAGRTNRKVGVASVVGEKTWIRAYVPTRREWLDNHSNALLGKTVYRMDAFRKLLKDENWNLDLPLTVRGCQVTVDTLGLAWELCLNKLPLGLCRESSTGDNYFPVRLLLEVLYGTKETNESFTRGTDKVTGEKDVLLWKGAKIPCATMSEPGVTLGRVRDLATWLGLDVVPDAASMTVNLTRRKA